MEEMTGYTMYRLLMALKRRYCLFKIPHFFHHLFARGIMSRKHRKLRMHRLSSIQDLSVQLNLEHVYLLIRKFFPGSHPQITSLLKYLDMMRKLSVITRLPRNFRRCIFPQQTTLVLPIPLNYQAAAQ